MNRPRPRIGIYCPGTGIGGPWRYVHSILECIDVQEFDIRLFCDIEGKYLLRPDIEVVPIGVAVPAHAPATVEYPMSNNRSRKAWRQLVPGVWRLWAGFARETRRLAAIFGNHSVDMLHTQNTGCEESAVAAKLAGVRHVIGTFHVDSTYDLHRERSGPGHRLLELVSNRCLDTAVAVSHATKRDWVRRSHVPANRVVTIHNGIDPVKFRRRQSRESARAAIGLPNGGLIVGGLGRLDEAKGFEYLLAAAARLRPEFPNLFIAIAGDGLLRKPLEAEAARLGIADRVRFLGFQSDVQLILDALDVFALPSLCETLGYALLEAMATELPTVGSAVGGVPEVIVPGETGFVVSPRNPDHLAEGLRTLLKDADLRAQMGAAGRERVSRNFHEGDMVRKTIDLYRSMVR